MEVVKGNKGFYSGSSDMTLDDYFASMMIRQLSRQLLADAEEIQIARRVFGEDRVNKAFAKCMDELDKLTGDEFTRKTGFKRIVFHCLRCEDTGVYFDGKGMTVCKHNY